MGRSSVAVVGFEVHVGPVVPVLSSFGKSSVVGSAAVTAHYRSNGTCYSVRDAGAGSDTLKVHVLGRVTAGVMAAALVASRRSSSLGGV